MKKSEIFIYESIEDIITASDEEESMPDDCFSNVVYGMYPGGPNNPL